MRIHIDSELRQWASIVLNEILVTGFDSDTITSKLMECGIMVDTGVLPVPRYWPNTRVSVVNNIVMELPLEDRNFVVGKRILGYSYTELGKLIGKSKWTAMNRMDEIEGNIKEGLINSPILTKLANR